MFLFGRRPRTILSDPLDSAIERSRRLREAATARAAVEIAVSRERNDVIRAELLETLRTGDHEDEDAAIDRLIEVGKRVRGER